MILNRVTNYVMESGGWTRYDIFLKDGQPLSEGLAKIARINRHPIFGSEVTGIGRITRNVLLSKGPQFYIADPQGRLGLPYFTDPHGRKVFVGIDNIVVDRNMALYWLNDTASRGLRAPNALTARQDSRPAFFNWLSSSANYLWQSLTDRRIAGCATGSFDPGMRSLALGSSLLPLIDEPSTRQIAREMRNLGVGYSSSLFDFSSPRQFYSFFLLSQVQASDWRLQHWGVNALCNFTLLRSTFGLPDRHETSSRLHFALAPSAMLQLPFFFQPEASAQSDSDFPPPQTPIKLPNLSSPSNAQMNAFPNEMPVSASSQQALLLQLRCQIQMATSTLASMRSNPVAVATFSSIAAQNSYQQALRTPSLKIPHYHPAQSHVPALLAAPVRNSVSAPILLSSHVPVPTRQFSRNSIQHINLLTNFAAETSLAQNIPERMPNATKSSVAQAIPQFVQAGNKAHVSFAAPEAQVNMANETRGLEQQHSVQLRISGSRLSAIAITAKEAKAAALHYDGRHLYHLDAPVNQRLGSCARILARPEKLVVEVLNHRGSHSAVLADRSGYVLARCLPIPKDNKDNSKRAPRLSVLGLHLANILKRIPGLLVPAKRNERVAKHVPDLRVLLGNLCSLGKSA
jgi:hypothetical protein